VADVTHRRTVFTKGTAVYHQGDPAGYWYEVTAGIVRTCRFMADGHRQLTAFHHMGDVFGVDGARYRESAEAVTDVVLNRFPAVDQDGGSDLGSGSRVLEKALESARRSIFLFGHRTAANRVAAFLIGMAERSAALTGVELPMTRSDIADHLNLTLHTVSRTMSDFARKGLIALDGPQTMRILDLDGLRIIAGDAVGGLGHQVAVPASRAG
jgi:CRP-like cAMP-binding protein